MWLTADLLKELPKTDLHLHLDGSLRPATLLELAEERGVKLPAQTEAGLMRSVFKQRYANLPDYLRGFALTCAVLQDSESLERTTYELCLDCQQDGVRYAEIRFAPQLHSRPGFDTVAVLEAVARGIQRAEREFNRRKEVRGGAGPAFRAGIIVCALRFFAGNFSRTYLDLLESLSDLPKEQVFGIASEALVRASLRARDNAGVPVVGVDLAGQERGFPAGDHRRAYQLAHQAFLGKTVHAGEAYGPESIFQAITDCHADRIGHGTWLFSRGHIHRRRVADKGAYIDRLVQYIAERRITIEVCLTSNQQTLPQLAQLSRHPFRKMVQHRLSATFCTDNRLVSRTTVSAEIRKAVEAFKLEPRQLKDLLVYGFKRSFFPGAYLEKRAYIRQVLDYRDAVFARHGVGA